MRKLAVHELNRVDTEAYKKANKLPICIVLDNIRSANNVGSVFRTADAFLIEKICLVGYTPKPPHKDIQKTALGATDSVAWAAYENGTDCIAVLKAEGYEIIAVEQAEGAVDLARMKWEKTRKYALVMGNEVKGVSDEVMQLADKAVEVPQWGTKHSLNISVCAGVVLWDVVKILK
ncbi:MAG: RNA methyltransferase [Bacteroidetes bacterium]|nr:RNA methyltransferase [Bacteroidota bacterium]